MCFLSSRRTILANKYFGERLNKRKQKLSYLSEKVGYKGLNEDKRNKGEGLDYLLIQISKGEIFRLSKNVSKVKLDCLLKKFLSQN